MKKSVRRQVGRATRPGFSLLELMLVLAIIGALMAVAAWNMLGAGTQAKNKATKMTLTTIKGQIDNYILNYSAPPPDLNTLVTVKIAEPKPMVDGFGNPIQYSPNSQNPERAYELWSDGADRTRNTPDDMDVWTMNNPNQPAATP